MLFKIAVQALACSICNLSKKKYYIAVIAHDVELQSSSDFGCLLPINDLDPIQASKNNLKAYNKIILVCLFYVKKTTGHRILMREFKNAWITLMHMPNRK